MYGDDPYRSAVVAMPSSAQLGGSQEPQMNPQGVMVPAPPPWVRFPFYPTSPWYSTNPNVGYQTRFYSTGIQSTDADFVVGAESIRPVQFDIPCRVVAVNAAAVDTSDFGRFNEQNMNLAWLLQVQYSMGDKLHTFPRLASEVVGTGRNPGEIGGHGYNVDQGSVLLCGITPLFAPTDPDNGAIRIDLTFVCLELRGPRNFTVR
jgi:hypothetical protein